MKTKISTNVHLAIDFFLRKNVPKVTIHDTQIFIKWSIIIIASDLSWASCSPAKVCPTKILELQDETASQRVTDCCLEMKREGQRSKLPVFLRQITVVTVKEFLTRNGFLARSVGNLKGNGSFLFKLSSGLKGNGYFLFNLSFSSQTNACKKNDLSFIFQQFPQEIHFLVTFLTFKQT